MKLNGKMMWHKNIYGEYSYQLVTPCSYMSFIYPSFSEPVVLMHNFCCYSPIFIFVKNNSYLRDIKEVWR